MMAMCTKSASSLTQNAFSPNQSGKLGKLGLAATTVAEPTHIFIRTK